MLGYSFIDPKDPVSVPPPKINGGLYTGESFKEGAPWRNFPVTPEAHLYTQNLASANPPPGGIAHIPGYTRPGNNEQTFPGHEVTQKAWCVR